MKDHSLLHAARQAQESNDLRRANDLFKQHLQDAGDEAEALAHYGMFCLHTEQYNAACYYLAKASFLLPNDAELPTQLGYAQLKDNDPGAALRSFETALKIAPNDSLALNGIGLCHMQAGSPREALQAFEQAGVEQDNIPILINIADACFQIGQMQRGIDYFERARAIAPHEPALLLEYARCLRESGSLEQALRALDGLAPSDRNQPLALLETARCLRCAARYIQAIESLQGLSRLLPDTPESHAEMGYCLPQDMVTRHAHWETACAKWIETEQFFKADALIGRMLEENPNSASAWNLKGISEEGQTRHAEAELAFEKAIELDRGFFNAYPNLATLLEELNRVEDARQIADTGLRLLAKLVDSSANAYVELQLVSCRIARRQKRLSDALEHLDRLQGCTLSDKQQLVVPFERGMVLDLLDRPAQAMISFGVGNAHARKLWTASNPGPNRFLVEVEDLLALASQGWLDRWPEPLLETIPADSPAHPVFLVGFPRSGTTLLNQILESNSFIQTLEEKPTVAKMREIVFRMPDGYPRAIPNCDRFDLDYLRHVYFEAVDKYCSRDDSLVLVDKLPFQIVRVALIQRVFPKARFLFAARHPCDVCLSCYTQKFRPNDAMSNFFSLEETIALYVRTMELWQVYQDKLPISVHTVRYDKTVTDFDAEMRNVCDFLGVPWQDSQADFAAHALQRGKIFTPSYEQVSQPIYRSALGRWEKYREYFEPYLPALQPWIDKYG